MILGILFPTWPNQREWDKFTLNSKAQWVLLAALQFAGITFAGLLLLFA